MGDQRTSARRHGGGFHGGREEQEGEPIWCLRVTCMEVSSPWHLDMTVLDPEDKSKQGMLVENHLRGVVA